MRSYRSVDGQIRVPYPVGLAVTIDNLATALACSNGFSPEVKRITKKAAKAFIEESLWHYGVGQLEYQNENYEDEEWEARYAAAMIVVERWWGKAFEDYPSLQRDRTN